MSRLEELLTHSVIIDRYQWAEKNAVKKETRNGYINYHFDDGTQYAVCWEGQIIRNEVIEWDAQ